MITYKWRLIDRLTDSLIAVLMSAEEEKDVDDWDVDMSVYYDADGGDKDARDMVTMRRDTRRRAGRHFGDETFDSAIGKFECHSKVFVFFFIFPLLLFTVHAEP